MIDTEIVNKTVPILRNYGIVHASVFGSFARGEQRPDSDLDLRIDYPGPKSLFELARMACELEDALGIKVDFVSAKAKIRPVILENILKDEVQLF